MTEKRLAAGQSSDLNGLPDSAFAVIGEGGKRGDDGRTKPLALRKYPHHDAAGKVDDERVASSLSELDGKTDDESTRAAAHLTAHRKDHKEVKSAPAAGVEVRVMQTDYKLTHRSTDNGDDVPVFEGYTALFNTRTQIGPKGIGFQEQIAPGAFKRALDAGADVAVLFNHNPDLLLARTASGTAKMREDDHGLWTAADLPPTELGRSVAVHTERGDLRGQSFSFRVNGQAGERWEILPDGTELRTLLDLDIVDGGPVTFPAYATTTATMRSEDQTVEIARRNRPAPEPATEEARELDAEALDAEENRAEWEVELSTFRSQWLDLGRDLY